jgi:hypothetical protein
MNMFDFDTNEVEELVLVKNKNRAERRKRDFSKARRKRSIAKDWYSNLHQYSKNKIHCSCGLCRFRSTYNYKDKTHSDSMREERTRYDMKCYKIS